jgi:predicted alpha/beta hydrolase family esterase
VSTKRQVFFLHSAGSQGKGEGSDRFAGLLEQGLGSGYEVRRPIMPEPDNPSFLRWRGPVERELCALDDGALLIGHSLGGSVLLKVLSEARDFPRIAGLFLVAVPFWGAGGWDVEEFVLGDDFAKRLPEIPRVVLYHSRDDDSVPFAHLDRYARALPLATVRPLDGFGHLFEAPCAELLTDIQAS